MPNKRRAERIKAMTFTTVYELDGHVLLGFLGDLTLQGAMVVGEKALKTQRDVTLEIVSLIGADATADKLTIPAHVAWCKQETESGYFNTGFEFLEMTPKAQKFIEGLIVKYKFSNNS